LALAAISALRVIFKNCDRYYWLDLISPKAAKAQMIILLKNLSINVMVKIILNKNWETHKAHEETQSFVFLGVLGDNFG